MTTNRVRKSRSWVGTSDGVPEDIYQAFTSGFGHLVGLDNGWKDRQTEAELRKAWKKYQTDILSRDMAENKARGRAGRRPNAYIEELEEKHPRLKVGTEKWMGPKCGPEPPKLEIEDIYETDEEYLRRLNLLEEWELTYNPPVKGQKRRQTSIGFT